MRTLSLFIIILTTLSVNKLYSQIEDADPGILDNSSTVDWDDPIYSSFFDGTYPMTKPGRSITEFKQTDALWSGVSYGSSSCGKTIGQKGCALTCMAMILASIGLSSWIRYLVK